MGLHPNTINHKLSGDRYAPIATTTTKSEKRKRKNSIRNSEEARRKRDNFSRAVRGPLARLPAWRAHKNVFVFIGRLYLFTYLYIYDARPCARVDHTHNIYKYIRATKVIKSTGERAQMNRVRGWVRTTAALQRNKNALGVKYDGRVGGWLEMLLKFLSSERRKKSPPPRGDGSVG